MTAVIKVREVDADENTSIVISLLRLKCPFDIYGVDKRTLIHDRIMT